ncbi:polyadenylate binding protein, partial [Tribonema minus]
MATRSVYLKGSPSNVEESAVRRALEPFGAVSSVTIPDDRPFCFAEFETEDAAQAVCAAGSVTVDGHDATVELRRGSSSRRGGGDRAPRGEGRGAPQRAPEGTSHSIYIPAVDDAATREDLLTAFAPFGTVISSQFRTSVQGRKYAFVEFESADVVSAIKSGGPYTICGQPVEVEERHSVQRHRAPRKEGGGGNANGRANGAYAKEGGGGGGGRPARTQGRLATPPKMENSVYVKGFAAEGATEDVIRGAFEAYGKIQSVILRIKPTEEGDVRAWAFVEFVEPEAVAGAVGAAAAEGVDVAGHAVTVEARTSE